MFNFRMVDLAQFLTDFDNIGLKNLCFIQNRKETFDFCSIIDQFLMLSQQGDWCIVAVYGN